MKGKAVSGMLLILLLIGVFPFVFDVQPVKASETIYIRADGSLDPPTANITSIDNVTYYFTDNNFDSIVVEKSNIIVDGNGYTLQGSGAAYSSGIDLSGRSNVTIKSMTITNFDYGIYLDNSVNNIFSGNNITENYIGFNIDYSSGNTISGNNITYSGFDGITLWHSSDNTISGNNITNNVFNHMYYSNSNIFSGNNITNDRREGIEFQYCSNNIISGNTIANFHQGGSLILGGVSNHTIIGNTIIGNGMWILSSNDSTIIGNTIVHIWIDHSSGNRFYHNNINGISYADVDFPNVWDNGYPSGGNYWSFYGNVDLYSGPYQNVTGSDGIGDTPYVIDANNADFYPLMSPYPSIHAISIEGVQLKTALAQGFNTKFDFHVANAHFTETFNVTAYANSTVFDNLTNVTVISGNSSTLTFDWNATSLPKGNYNLTVCATPVPAELFTQDNTYTYWVLITLVGDVDGDRDVDVGDQRKVQVAMFSHPGDPNWDPNMDIDCDLDVDVGDQRKQQLHMFESW